MLNRSLGVRLQEFTEAWAAKRRECEERCERLLAATKEHVEAAAAQLEREMERERMPPVKYSPLVRDNIKQEKKLVQAELFDQAAIVHTRLEAQKLRETEAWEKAFRDDQETRRRQLAKKLAHDTDNMIEKVAGIKHTFEKELRAAQHSCMLNCRNLTSDMQHAFAREWFQRPEVSVSAKISNKSRIAASATFMGSHLQDKALGGQFDLPSLSRVHFEGAQLRGTAADLALVKSLDQSHLLSPRGDAREDVRRSQGSPAARLALRIATSSSRSGATSAMPSTAPPPTSGSRYFGKGGDLRQDSQPFEPQMSPIESGRTAPMGD